MSGTTIKAVTKRRSKKTRFPPASLVQLLSPDEWEDFIEDCCRIQMDIEKKYVYVQRIGGSGDAGRDIEARYSKELLGDGWDLYQAKRYQSAVGESTLFPELAKLFHHLSVGTYPVPRNYYICAPKNTTPALHDLIAKPTTFKNRFHELWKAGKVHTQYPPTSDSLNILEHFNFNKIHEFPVKDLIDIHAKNRKAHEELFGIEAVRGMNPITPAEPTVIEQIYIDEILKVYSETDGHLISLGAAMSSETYGEHLNGCRTEFYSAEGLKRFSRDIYPGEFEHLLSEVRDGVRRQLASPRWKNGMERMDAVLDHASNMHITGNPLAGRLFPSDLPGACHHLVNEKKMKWVK